MSAMPAVELPEEAAGLLDEPADLLAIVAAVQPMDTAVGTTLPSPSAAHRAAARWAQPRPAAASPAAPAVASPAAASPVAVRPAAASPSTAPPLRLTRRGRIVIAAATAVLATALSLIVAGAAQATSQAPAAPGRGVTQLTVRPGQSLWSVAESADPSADTRAVVQQIVELNGLTGSAVFAGQHLWVPRG